MASSFSSVLEFFKDSGCAETTEGKTSRLLQEHPLHIFLIG